MSHWRNVFVTVFVSVFWQDVAEKHRVREEAVLKTRAWPGLAQVSKLPSSSTSASSRLRRDHTHFPRLQGITWHFLMATHGRCWPDTGPSEKYKLPARKNCSLLWNDSLEWQAWYPKCVWGLAWICAEVTWGRERNLPYTGNSALPSEGPGPIWIKFISLVPGLVTHFSTDKRQCSA